MDALNPSHTFVKSLFMALLDMVVMVLVVGQVFILKKSVSLFGSWWYRESLATLKSHRSFSFLFYFLNIFYIFI